MAKFRKIRDRIRPYLSIVIAGVCAYLAMYVMIAAAVTPERYDLRAGQVAPITITATKDVTDEITTEQLRSAASAAVQPSYVSDDTALALVLADVDDAFTRMEDLREREGGENPDDSALLEVVSMLGGIELTEEDARLILTSSDADLSSLAAAARRYARETLFSLVREGQESEAVSKIARDLRSEGFSDGCVSIATKIVTAYMRPNMLLDEESTQANRQKAVDAVEEVRYKQGQNIVSAGEPITRAQYEVLLSLGLINDHSVDMKLYCGIALLLALLCMVIVTYLYIFERALLRDPRQVMLLCVILVLTVAISLLFQLVSVYLMPVTLGVMLATLLLKPRVAVILNVVLAIVTGLMSSSTTGVFTSSVFNVMVTTIVSGSVCIAVANRTQLRTGILLAGFVAGLTNVASTISVGLINNADMTSVYAWAGWSGGSGVLSAVCCIGLQPALEWLFNLVTATKLLELSNPNQPLMRRLLLEAPGTYHHSIIVANLSEAAANAIGANGLLARVGAYYHDVGKLKRPLYFKENQMGDNPHDRTDPVVSTAILTAHPRDGVQMAQKQRIPEPVLDIIAQHHGDTPVLYFYDRALKQNPNREIDIADFRYEGPKPLTKEAAIVMLADTVEAAARALPDPDMEKMNALIRRLVRAKTDDGQLDDCPLTFSDIDKTCRAFLTVLTGVFHERIEYPTLDVPGKGQPLPAPKETEKPDAPSKEKESEANPA